MGRVTRELDEVERIFARAKAEECLKSEIRIERVRILQALPPAVRA